MQSSRIPARRFPLLLTVLILVLGVFALTSKAVQAQGNQHAPVPAISQSAPSVHIEVNPIFPVTDLAHFEFDRALRTLALEANLFVDSQDDLMDISLRDLTSHLKGLYTQVCPQSTAQDLEYIWVVVDGEMVRYGSVTTSFAINDSTLGGPVMLHVTVRMPANR